MSSSPNDERSEEQKPQDAAITEPEIKKKRKRQRGWDLDSAIAEAPNVGSQPPTLSFPTVSAAELLLQQQQQQILALQKAQLAQQALASTLALPQITQQQNQQALSRRIYVGSIHYDLKESDMVTLFSTFGTVVKSEMSIDSMTGRSKGFCFIEFADATSAEAAMAMDGFELAGRKIKVGRPHHGQSTTPAVVNPLAAAMLNPLALTAALGVGVGTGAALLPKIASPTAAASAVNSLLLQQQLQQVATIQAPVISHAPAISTTTAVDSVMISNVPDAVGEQEVRTIFEAFGSIISCSRQGPGRYVVRYDDPAGSSSDGVAARTAAAMNGFDLAGQQLQCATIGSVATPAAATSASTSATAALLAVLLKNMVTAEDLKDPELKDEIADEARNYGALKDVEFQPQSSGSGEVQVLLRYAAPQDAERAFKAMQGRVFAGRKISAELRP